MIKKKSLIYSFVFFTIIIGITYYIIFNNNSILDMLNSISNIKIIYIFIITLCMILYFVLQGLFTKKILENLNEKISIKKGAFYAITEFFFSAITPGASGGQPLVMYYMSKDNIPIKKSSLVMMTSTIIFKLYFIVSTLIILLFKKEMIFSYGKLGTIMFFLGITVDVVLIIIYLLLMYNKKIIKRILKIFYKIKEKLTKKETNIDNRVEEVLSQYSENANYIKQYKKRVLLGILITFIQRTIMFSVPYIIYRGFGFTNASYFDILILQVFINICLECIFIPGAAGANELITNSLFLTYFGELSTSAMVLLRTVTFYIPLVIITIIILVVTKLEYKNFYKEY